MVKKSRTEELLQSLRDAFKEKVSNVSIEGWLDHRRYTRLDLLKVIRLLIDKKR